MRIITFYQTVPPSVGGGPGSVYAQHLTHFSNLKRREYTRTAFLSDLYDDINTWKSKGNQIISIGDTNKYILGKKIRNSATKLGPRELITDKYGSMGPGTTRANKKQLAIHGICGSQGITIFQGGYLPYHFGPK